MTRRRRAVLLLGLSILLGGLAAAEVSRRESALTSTLGSPVEVVVARIEIPAGTALSDSNMKIREIPAKYAPGGSLGSKGGLVGLRAAVGIAAGATITVGQVGDGSARQQSGAPVGLGERVAEVVASGPLELVAPGGRVDVLVTKDGVGDQPGSTVLALEDVEVLSAVAVSQDGSTGASSSSDASDPSSAGTPVVETSSVEMVHASLRVTLRQAVYLAAAQSFARELRLLPRAPGDRRRGAAGLRVGSGLG